MHVGAEEGDHELTPLTRTFLPFGTVEHRTRLHVGPNTELPTAAMRLPVIAPPLVEQKAIAGVLGALDDKIELNRRMNGTLEAMARATADKALILIGPFNDLYISGGGIHDLDSSMALLTARSW